MSTDGGLRQSCQDHMKDVHIQSVETWSTGQGVPDFNYCAEGVEGWVEAKATSGWALNFEIEQIGWIERRRRKRGRVFIFVRRVRAAGPRNGAALDEIWIFPGDDVKALSLYGLEAEGVNCLLMASGGPAKWPWPRIRSLLVDFDFLSLQKSGKV